MCVLKKYSDNPEILTRWATIMWSQKEKAKILVQDVRGVLLCVRMLPFLSIEKKIKANLLTSKKYRKDEGW